MIPFIDNINYNGPLPNFSRDSMSWEKMQHVTESTLDRGHFVFCDIDELGWVADPTIDQESSDQEVDTLEDLQNLSDLTIGLTVWVISEESGFIYGITNERRGHYIFLGMKNNLPEWAKIINIDGSIAGKVNVTPITDEFIDNLNEDPIESSTPESNPE